MVCKILFTGYATTLSYLINENFDAATTPQLPPVDLKSPGEFSHKANTSIHCYFQQLR